MCHVLWATFFTVSQKVRGGGGVCMALSIRVYCTFLSFDISIAKPVVFLELHFDFYIPNIPYIITVFSFQCNAFLRHSYPTPHPAPTWRQAQVKSSHDRRSLAGFVPHAMTYVTLLLAPYLWASAAPLSRISLISSFISLWGLKWKCC